MNSQQNTTSDIASNEAYQRHLNSLKSSRSSQQEAEISNTAGLYDTSPDQAANTENVVNESISHVVQNNSTTIQDRGAKAAKEDGEINEENGDDDEEDDWRFCKFCKIAFGSLYAYNMHLRGSGHMFNVSKQQHANSKMTQNDAVSTNSFQENKVRAARTDQAVGQYNTHKSPGGEKRKLEEAEENADTDRTFCSVCKIKFSKETAYRLHLRGSGHMFNMSKQQNANSKKTENVAVPTKSSEGNKVQASRTDQAVEQYSTQKSPVGEKRKLEEEAEENEDTDRTFCSVCNIKFSKETAYWAHTRGLAHYHKAEELEKRKNPEAYRKQQMERESQSTASRAEALPSSFTEGPQRKKAKGFQAAWTKDITLNEFGDYPTSYYCEVCEVTCTGYKCFQAHVEGKSHLKKLKKLQIVEDRFQHTDKRPNADTEGRTSIQNEIDSCKEPLVGLDYLTEFQKEDPKVEPAFVCDLCSSGMDPRQVIGHVVGTKHRMKYFKFHAPKFYTILYNKPKKSEKNTLAVHMATQIEAEEGRYSIRLKVEADPFSRGPRWRELDTGASRPKHVMPGFKASTSQYEVEKADVEDRLALPDPFQNMMAGRTNERYRQDVPAATGRPVDSGAYGRGSTLPPPPIPTFMNSIQPLPPASKPQVIDYGHTAPAPPPKPTPLPPPPPLEPPPQQPPPPPLPPPQEPDASAASNKRFSYAASKAKDILRSLGQCEVTSEHDAEVALQISNALTQALLNFRMKSMSGAVGHDEVQTRLQSLSDQAKNIERTHFDDSRSVGSDSQNVAGQNRYDDPNAYEAGSSTYQQGYESTQYTNQYDHYEQQQYGSDSQYDQGRSPYDAPDNVSYYSSANGEEEESMPGKFRQENYQGDISANVGREAQCEGLLPTPGVSGGLLPTPEDNIRGLLPTPDPHLKSPTGADVTAGQALLPPPKASAGLLPKPDEQEQKKVLLPKPETPTKSLLPTPDAPGLLRKPEPGLLPKPEPGLLPNPEAQGLLPKPEAQGLLPKPETQGLLPKPNAQDLLAKLDGHGLLPKPNDKGLLPTPEVKSLLPHRDGHGLLMKPDPEGLLPKPDSEGLLPTPESKGLLPAPEQKGLLATPESQGLLPTPDTKKTLLPKPEYAMTSVGRSAEHFLTTTEGMSTSDALEQASGLINDLAHFDLNLLSAVDTDQLNKVLQTVSGINMDLAKSIPIEVLEAATEYAGQVTAGGGLDLSALPDELANMCSTLASQFPTHTKDL